MFIILLSVRYTLFGQIVQSLITHVRLMRDARIDLPIYFKHESTVESYLKMLTKKKKKIIINPDGFGFKTS